MPTLQNMQPRSPVQSLLGQDHVIFHTSLGCLSQVLYNHFWNVAKSLEKQNIFPC